jgi:hypothetical protein
MKTVEHSFIPLGRMWNSVGHCPFFYLDPASRNGERMLFCSNTTKGAAITEEVLSLVTSWIPFVFDSSGGLYIFAELIQS